MPTRSSIPSYPQPARTRRTSRYDEPSRYDEEEGYEMQTRVPRTRTQAEARNFRSQRDNFEIRPTYPARVSRDNQPRRNTQALSDMGQTRPALPRPMRSTRDERQAPRQARSRDVNVEDQLPHHSEPVRARSRRDLSETQSGRSNDRSRPRRDPRDNMPTRDRPRTSQNTRTRTSDRAEESRHSRPARSRYEQLEELESQRPRRQRARNVAASEQPAEPIEKTPAQLRREKIMRLAATGVGATVGLVNPIIASFASANSNGFGSQGGQEMIANGITIGSILVGTAGLGGVGFAETSNIGKVNKIALGSGTAIGLLAGIINAATNTDNMTDAVVINYIAVCSGLGAVALPALWGYCANRRKSSQTAQR